METCARRKEHDMTTKKPALSKNKSTAEKRGERRKAKLNVSSEAARKAPIRVFTGDDDNVNDLEIQR
jgi:hypothetical protein